MLSNNHLTHYAILVCITWALGGCSERPVTEPVPLVSLEQIWHFPQRLEKEVDILFVIDNSGSMEQEQENLANNFPKLIDALRTPKLDNRIPNIRIGVISTNLGAAGYTAQETCEKEGGDQAQLLHAPLGAAGCRAPSEPWISYNEGQTNVASETLDPVQQVKEAFSCIAKLGTKGCHYEQPLEAAKKALQREHANLLQNKPSFLRKDAFLAVVFITDEDDCSAQNPELFFPQATEELGLPYSYRCFRFGIRCDITDPNQLGPRADCRPDGNWLFPIDHYLDFFKKLNPGRVLVSAIAGPTDTVEVVSLNGQPWLGASCQVPGQGSAAPALRIKQFVDGFGDKGQFSSICTDDFGPALNRLGNLIIAHIDTCIDTPLLARNGSLVCGPGDTFGPSTQPRVCEQGCLAQADCIVRDVTADGLIGQDIPRCPAATFNDPGATDCGATCPCWRILPNSSCRQDGPGYAVDILRKSPAPQNALAQVKCNSSIYPWTSPQIAALPQCE